MSVCRTLMMRSDSALLLSALTLLTYDAASLTEVRVIFLCDLDVHNICEELVSNSMPRDIAVNTDHISLSGKAVRSAGDLMTDIKALQNIDDPQTILFVGFGRDHVVNAVSCMSRGTGVPAIVYSTSHHRSNMYKNDIVSIHPDHEGLARAILTVIGKQMVENTYIICQDSLTFDGFITVFRQEHELHNRYNKRTDITVSSSESDLDIRLHLLNIHDNGYRLIVVHTSPELFERISKVATNMSYFDVGYAWVITEEAMSYVPLTTNVSVSIPADEHIPVGVLAVDGYEVDKYKSLTEDVIKVVRKEIWHLLTKVNEYGLTTRYMAENFRVVLVNREDVRNDFIRGIGSNKILFGSDGRRAHMQYRLLNFIEDRKLNDSTWRTVGYIRGTDLDLNTVVWPGYSIFGPIYNTREYISIVTRHAEPFMYIRGPVESRDKCAADTECLEVFTYDPAVIKSVIEKFRRYHQPTKQHNYSIYCCEGIVVDILHALSIELKFDFVLYFQDDQNYGHYRNGTWSGMVGDVINGAADIMAGAISITSGRMNAISFTEAFYFSSFNMIAGDNDRYTTLLAFMNPFDPLVWLTIITSATIVAFITSIFEWNSPFGLNPWGKCRKKNYTLGSAITMVYSIWFGHTVKTKSPKSWPSKFLQNCWSCLSIFVLASYTANLAAFLAGNAEKDAIYSILDAQLRTKRIGVVQTSAVEEHIRTINPVLQDRFRNYYVIDLEEAFFNLRNNRLDMYVDDSPLLEYALSRFDDNCSIKYASHIFGESSYAFGIKKGSLLKKKLDPFILNFVELGYVEDLKWRYMGKNRKCSSKLNANNGDMQFGLQHTGGLFVFLLGAIGLSIILLILEHITYFVVLPKLKRKPPSSIWKKRNVEYFSQRLYKSINGEKVDAPAKLLLSKVKKRKFELQTRMRRQTKRIPADLTAFQLGTRELNHILDIAYKNSYETQNIHSDGDIFTISGSIEEELDEDWEDIVTELSRRHSSQHSDSSQPQFETLEESCYDNPVFEPDDIDIVLENTGSRRSQRCESCSVPIEDSVSRRSDTHIRGSVISRKTQLSKTRAKQTIQKSREIGVYDEKNGSNQWRKSKRYETWPSPQARKRSVQRTQNNNAKSFSKGDREQVIHSNRIVNEIPTRTCRTCSSSSLDSLTLGRGQAVNLEVKDNRMKSSLRHHAMASTDRRRSMAFDQYAVEALSKEDLLVLWKRSEIELQTRLNRMLHQNKQLRELVHIVEEYQRIEDTASERQHEETSEIDPQDETPVIATTKL